jgi:hypothetical protein
VAAGQPAGAFRCWSEDHWEDTIVRNPDLEAQARFLNKYGGIVFHDGDDVFTIHPTKMYFCQKRGNSHWTLFFCKEVLIQDPALDRLPVSAIQSYYVRAGQQDGYLPVTYLLGIPAPLQSSQ